MQYNGPSENKVTTEQLQKRLIVFVPSPVHFQQETKLNLIIQLNSVFAKMIC